jgi:hypothetical protein
MKTKKEIKEEYKLMKFKMGVFQIKNQVNNKIFVGSSLDLNAIWHAQKLQLGMGMHQNSQLQSDWNQFGADHFTYQILEELTPGDDPAKDYNKEIKALEELIIEQLQPFDNKGYNTPKKK